MRWWRRHRDEQGHARAEEALERTREKREESQEKDAAGWGLAGRIRQMREANHLAEAIEQALREGRQ